MVFHNHYLGEQRKFGRLLIRKWCLLYRLVDLRDINV